MIQTSDIYRAHALLNTQPKYKITNGHKSPCDWSTPTVIFMFVLRFCIWVSSYMVIELWKSSMKMRENIINTLKTEFYLLYKNSVRTSHETHYVSAKKTSRLKLFRKKICLVWTMWKTQIPSVKRMQFWRTKVGGAYSNHWSLKGLYLVTRQFM
jgi:hypothetical protein